MVQLSTILASIAIIHQVTAAPTSILMRSSGESLSVSEDGESVTLGGQTLNIRHAMKNAKSCKKGANNDDNDNNDDNAGQDQAEAGQGEAGQGAQAAAGNAKALYFMTNAAKNSIVALNVAQDGTLSDGSMTDTGGAGMAGVDAEGKPALPDGTFSQGAVKVEGNMMVAVNPGSNTVSMFTIDEADPTKLTMVGEPADTLGEFPMSATISTKLSMACVANSGAKAGVACFSMDAQKGLTAMDKAQRPFQINQSTPPVGPTNTVSQVFFNSDSTKLMTTVKGDPAINNTGFLSVFNVEDGKVSTEETRSSPKGTAVLFGTSLLPSGNSDLFVTDASFGSATLSVGDNNKATISAQTKVADQKATCWAAFSAKTGTAFVTDVGVNHLVEVDTATGELVRDLDSTNGNPGMIDMVAQGDFVYALSPGNGTTKAAVTAFDVSGGRGTAKEIQNFNPAGVDLNAQGMTSL